MTYLPILAAALPLLAALMLAIFPPPRASWRLRLPEWAALGAMLCAAAAIVLVVRDGPATGALFGIAGLGLSARVDAVSLTMLALVAFVGWIVMRFAATYTDGEPRQAAFLGWLSATLAMVMLLVTAGNLGQLVGAWVVLGITLNRALLFYPDRSAAQRAARKKAVSGLIGSLSLVAAAACLTAAYGTADIAAILDAARGGDVPLLAGLAAGLLAVAAVAKSAQVPLHGWLTEVMEAPTPLSALLHAGVINAGGFLLIRFADLLVHAPGVLAALVVIGGFSALLGGIVMLTQPAVKTSLAWSTLAQMGFMVLQCGLALFPLALLHIVAHSLYKAHAFLASGGAVEVVAATRRPGPVAAPGGREVAVAFLSALGLYAVVGTAFGAMGKSPQAIALGAILVFGVAYLVAQGTARAAPGALARRTAIYALAATVSYFTLQTLAGLATAGTLPPAPTPGALEWVLIVLALLSFGLVALAQSLFPLWATHPAAAGLRVHLANGLYLNAVLDRLIRGWSTGAARKG